MKYLDRLLHSDDTTSIRAYAQSIIDVITKDRDAVFLRADEERGGWYVMDYGSSLNKVMLALKNAEIKALKEGTAGTGPLADPGLRKKQKAKRKSAGGQIKFDVAVHAQDLPTLDYNEGPPPKKVVYRCVYQVKEGPTVVIDPYAKDIINLMCKQSSPNDAVSALDTPLVSRFKTVEDEPSKERLLRLQLRQRYIAAMSIGMSPVSFSRKLMEFWGGSIVDRNVPIDEETTGGKRKESDTAKAENEAQEVKKDDENMKTENKAQEVKKDDENMKTEIETEEVKKDDENIAQAVADVAKPMKTESTSDDKDMMIEQDNRDATATAESVIVKKEEQES
jgi:hypothetical protein